MGPFLGHSTEAGRWPGANPVREARTYAVPKGVAEYLRDDEVSALLAYVSDAKLPLVAMAVHTGLRKGELAGLRKRDVHLDDGNPRIHVTRSWDRSTTKSGKGRVVAVCAECVPYLRAAMDASSSELVFPGPGGGLMDRSTDLVRVVRRALADAGVVEGYTHVCRARVNVSGNRDRNAPRCPSAHDGEPAAAPGTSLADIGALLGHSNVTVTERYAHMSPERLRSVVESLRFGSTPERPPSPPCD